MIKAVILLDDSSENSGEVVNLIQCDERGIMGLVLPLNQTIWDISGLDVAIGDRWCDGVFTREELPVSPLPTIADEVYVLEEDIATVKTAITELVGLVAVATMSLNENGGAVNVQ